MSQYPQDANISPKKSAHAHIYSNEVGSPEVLL